MVFGIWLVTADPAMCGLPQVICWPGGPRRPERETRNDDGALGRETGPDGTYSQAAETFRGAQIGETRVDECS